MDRLNIPDIKNGLKSNVPMVRRKAMQTLEALIRQQKKLLNPDDPALRELVQLLAAPPIQSASGKPVRVDFVPGEAEVRASFQQTLSGMDPRAAKEMRDTLSAAHQAISAHQQKMT